METRIFHPKRDDAGIRLDVYCAAQEASLTRSRIASLIRDGQLGVNGKPAKAGMKLNGGEEIRLEIPAPQPMELKAEDLPLDIVYEDGDIVVINKPRGMVVHPAVGNMTGTLVHALMYHCRDLSGIGGTIRPGIVHRIDKDTTGLLVVAKTDRAHQSLTEQLAQRRMHRTYWALVEGVVKNDGQVDAPIARHPVDRKKMAVVPGGREALTFYHVQERFTAYTLLECRLATGRTHQIRVHMAHIKHPVVGDPVYGIRKQAFTLEGQLLHALRLELCHPVTGKTMEFSAPLPEDFAHVLQVLRRREGRPL